MGSTGKTAGTGSAGGGAGSGEINVNTESGMAQYMYGKDWRELTEEEKSAALHAVMAIKDGTLTEVDFKGIVKASDNSVSFDKVDTILLDKGVITSVKKKDIGQTLNDLGVTEFKGDMYRDKSGANDLKRLKEAGYIPIAVFYGKAQGNIPPRDFYHFIKAPTNTGEGEKKKK